jgi:tetratricopeptide (TPR) repeat protein
MKTAGEWYEEGIAALASSRTADHLSELRDDLARAAAAFEQALAQQPDHADARRWCAFALGALERHERAIECFAAAIALQPDDVELRVGLGQALWRVHRPEQALAAFEAALRLQPGDEDAAYGRAEALTALGRYEQCLPAWDAVLARPDSPMRTRSDFVGRRSHADARLQRATALARLGRTEAAGAFAAAIERDQAHLEGPLSPASFLVALRELEPARTAYRRHVAAHADDPDAWRRAGDVWLRAGCSDEALAACGELVRRSAADAGAWWLKAEAHMQRQEVAPAIAAYERSLALQPGFLAAQARLRVALAAIRSWRVMGCDTFAREDYVVGDFPTKAEAEACVRRREAAVAVQDEPLRDTFWIVPMP